MQKRIALESTTTDDDVEIVVIVSPDEQMLTEVSLTLFRYELAKPA